MLSLFLYYLKKKVSVCGAHANTCLCLGDEGRVQTQGYCLFEVEFLLDLELMSQTRSDQIKLDHQDPAISGFQFCWEVSSIAFAFPALRLQTQNTMSRFFFMGFGCQAQVPIILGKYLKTVAYMNLHSQSTFFHVAKCLQILLPADILWK